MERGKIGRFTAGAMAAPSVSLRGDYRERIYVHYQCLVTVVAAWVKKESVEQGWVLLPSLWEKVEHHGVFSAKQEWSVYDERPKNYDVTYIKPQ